MDSILYVLAYVGLCYIICLANAILCDYWNTANHNSTLYQLTWPIILFVHLLFYILLVPFLIAKIEDHFVTRECRRLEDILWDKFTSRAAKIKKHIYQLEKEKNDLEIKVSSLEADIDILLYEKESNYK